MKVEQALESVLACPVCHGRLVRVGDRIACRTCDENFSIVDEIPVLMNRGQGVQEAERRMRDAVAAEVADADESAMAIVRLHHCVPVMEQRAIEFRSSFAASEFVLDVGIGYGWHWRGSGTGAPVIGVDMSLGSLRVARHLLRDEDNVFLICADAAALPIRDCSIAGVWSVQVFQHFTDDLFMRVQRELDRVLAKRFAIEIYNLNPASAHRVIYQLFRKPFHVRGRLGEMELNRLSGTEALQKWGTLREGRTTVGYGFSELFFHPNFRVRPSHYPARLERFLTRTLPFLSRSIARQVHVRVESKE